MSFVKEARRVVPVLIRSCSEILLRSGVKGDRVVLENFDSVVLNVLSALTLADLTSRFICGVVMDLEGVMVEVTFLFWSSLDLGLSLLNFLYPRCRFLTESLIYPPFFILLYTVAHFSRELSDLLGLGDLSSTPLYFVKYRCIHDTVDSA